MNSDTRRIRSNYETYRRPDYQQPHYYHSTAPSQEQRLNNNPAAVITASLLLLAILYQFGHHQGWLPPWRYLLWDFAVSVIPADLLFAIERWVNPPLFPQPNSMLQAQSRSNAAKTESLRRIFRQDKPGGFMSQVGLKGFGSLPSLPTASLRGKQLGDHPPGLGNYDNSCYQNSILQSLAALKTLPEYLSGLPHPTRYRPELTTEALRDLVRDLNDSSHNGQTLWTPPRLKNMSTWQQQDAQEYYSKLLDVIDKEIKPTKHLPRQPSFDTDLATDDASASQHSDDSGYHSQSSHSKTAHEVSVNKNPLEGLVAQRVACVTCGYCEGLSMIPFNCLTVNLGTDQLEYDLSERLDNYTKVEPISGVECPKCSLLSYHARAKSMLQKNPDQITPQLRERLSAIEEALQEENFDDRTLDEICKLQKRRETSTKTKQVVIARPPQSLAIHINRSVFDENTGHLSKNLAAVRFPWTLDLGPWCLGSANRITGADGDKVKTVENGKDEEQWHLDPLESMVAGNRGPSRVTGPIYELRAVVTHFGNHENGHYVCYRRHRYRQKTKATESGQKPPQLASKDNDRKASQRDEMDFIKDANDGGMNPAEDKSSANEGSDPEGEDIFLWYRLSDNDVTKVSEFNVLSQGGVFMLFYDCIDPNSVLISDVEGLIGTKGGIPENNSAGTIQQLPTPPETEPSEDGVSVFDGAAGAQGDVLSKAASVPLPGDEDGL